ncbi:MAG TPA: hypothetical protein VD813_14560, partial [Pseudonocardia sp.]|nr:hypothetical protein [Pseudonocardia sp.]
MAAGMTGRTTVGATGRADAGDRAEAVQQRLESLIGRYSPYVGVGIGLALTPMIVQDAGPAFWLPVGALVVAVLVWSLVFVTLPPVRAQRPAAGAVYMSGLLVLMALLVVASPLFAFMALSGYAHALAFLRGTWRWATVAGIAVLAAYSQVGGRFAEPDVGVGVTFAVLVVVNALLAGVFA